MQDKEEVPARKASTAPWLIVAVSLALAVAATLVVIYFKAPAPKEKSWDQKFNDEVASLDVNLGDQHDSPAFEFYLNEHPPRFSAITCIGESSKPQLQKDAWDVFFNEVRKYGPAESYKLDFHEAGEVDGQPITRVMLFVNLHEGAGQDVAQDVARKVVNVMKASSPCR